MTRQRLEARSYQLRDAKSAGTTRSWKREEGLPLETSQGVMP